MKLKIIFMILSLLLLFNCKRKAQIRVIIDTDNSKNINWDKDKFVSKCTNLIAGLNKKIIVTSIDSTNDFEILKENLFNYNKLSLKKDKYTDYIICILPQMNYKNNLEYSVIFGSASYKKKDVNLTKESFKNVDDILNTIKKNIPQEDSLNPIFFIWEKKVLSATVSLITDLSSDIDWDRESFENSLIELFTKKLQRKVSFTEKSNSIPIEKIKTDPKILFDELDIKLVNNDNNYLFYIKPYKDKETNSNKFEMAFFTSMADPQSLEIIKSISNNPTDIIDKITSYFTDSQFTNKTKIYVWIEPEHLPKSIYLYKSFSNIETLKGTYLLVDSIPGIITKRKLKMADIIANGKFNPQDNKKCKEISDYLATNDSYSLFYNKDKKTKNIKIVFVEYITTGDRYILTLFGPVNEDDFSQVRSFLKERKIKTYSKLVYPYDLK